MTTLTNQEAGSVCRITWMMGLPEIFNSLQTYYHIGTGSTLRVICKDRNAMLIGIGEYRFALDKKVTDHIRVCTA